MSEFENKNCSQEDALFLQNQLVAYYLKSDENDSKWNLLMNFNKNSANFKHMDLIEELKKDGLANEEEKNEIN